MPGYDSEASPPKVSVLVLTYNHEHFIAKALRSILDQERDFALEIVVGEDSSTDGTRAIVEQYAERYPKIVRLLPTSGNIGMARNFAEVIKECRGEYVATCDGDDYWCDSRKLIDQVGLMDRQPDLSFCHSYGECFFEEDGREQVMEIRPSERINDERRDLIDHCRIMASTVLLRRAWLPPMDERLLAIGGLDWPLLLSLSFKGSIGFVDRVTVRYRVHSGNAYRLWPFVVKMAGNCRTQYYVARHAPQHLRREFLQRGDRLIYSAMASLKWIPALTIGWQLSRLRPTASGPLVPMSKALLRYTAMRFWILISRRKREFSVAVRG